MINSLLSDFRRYALLNASYESPATQRMLLQTLKGIEQELKKNKYKCDPSTIEDKVSAATAFYYMFEYGIAEAASSYLCYCLSTLVAEDINLPMESRLKGYMCRALITYKNLSNWNLSLSVLYDSPLSNYAGHLDFKTFIDFMLLSDIYGAWDIDPSNPIFDSLKRMAPGVKDKYPKFSMTEIIYEGTLAHQAVFNIFGSKVIL